MRPESLLNDREPFSTKVSSILIVEDSIEDSIAITRLLRQNQSTSLRIRTAPNMLDALREFRHERPDCVLIDHRLQDGEGIELLHMLSEVTAPMPAPVIYMASEDSPRLAVRALKAGALDYLAKSWLDAESLKTAIDRAVEKVAIAKARYQRQRATEDKNRDLQKSVQTLQQSEKVKEQITGLAPTFLYIYDLLEDQLVYSNPTMQNTLGYSDADMREMSRGGIRKLIHPDDLALYEAHLSGLTRLADGEISETEIRVHHHEGEWIWLHLRETVFLRDKHNTVWQIIGSAENVSAQKASRESLVARTTGLELELNDLKTVWNQGLIGIAITVKNRSNQLKLNSVLANLLELSEETDLGSFARVFGFTFASSPFGKALSRGTPTRNAERTIHRSDGTSVRIIETVHPLTDGDGTVTGCIAYYVPLAEGEAIGVGQEDDVWHSRLSQIQSKLDVTEAQKNRAEEQLTKSERLAEERQGVVEQLEQAVERLRFDLDSNIEAFSQADEMLVQANARIAEAEIRLAESEKRWQDSVSNLLDTEENKSSLSAQILQLQSEAVNNRTQLDTLRAEIAGLEQKGRIAAEAVKSHQLDLKRVEAALEVASNRAAEAEAALLANSVLSELLKTQIGELQSQISLGEEQAKRATQLETQLQEVRSHLITVEQDRDSALQSYEDLESQLKQIIDEQTNSKLNLETHEDQTQALRLQVELLSTRISQAEEEKDRLITGEKELTEQLAQIREQLGKATTEASQRENELANLRTDLEEVTARRREAESTLADLHHSVEAYQEIQREQSGKIARLESLLVDLEASRSDLEIQRDAAVSESEALKVQDQTSSARLIQAEAKAAGLETLITRLTQDLETNAQTLDAEKQSLSALRIQIDTLRASEAKANALVRTLEQTNREQGERILRVEELAVSRGESLAELGKVVDRGAELLAEARAKRDESEKHILSLEEQIRTSQNRLHLAEENWHKAESDLNARNREVAQLTGSLKERNEEVENLKLACTQLTTQRTEAEAQLANWLESAPESARKLQEATEQLAIARNEIALLVETKDRLTVEADSARKEKEAMLELHSVLTQQFQSLTLDYEKVSQELSTLSENHRVTVAELARLEKESSTIRAELAQTRSQLENAQREVQSLDAQLRQRTAELEARIEEIVQLKIALSQSEEGRKLAQDRLIESENTLRQSQHNLRASEEKYRSLAANVPAVVFTTNSLGMIEYVNDRWERYVGQTMVESKESAWKDVVFKDDLDAFSHAWIAGIKDGNAFSVQFRLKRNDNQFRWHELHHSPDTENGRVLRWYGTIHEIHEQVVSREAARQARLRYGALLDGTSESVLFLSPNGNVLGASKSSLNLLRQGGEGVVGQYLWETKWWPKAESDKLQDAVRKAAAGERVEVTTLRVDTDGQHRKVCLSINPIHDENKQVAMLVPYFKDI